MDRKVLFYFFDGMVDFEVSFLMALLDNLSRSIEIVSVAEDVKPIKSAYGITFIPQMSIDEAENLDDAAALVITGGADTGKDRNILRLIQKMNDENKILAAICFGPMYLAEAGILTDHKYTTTALPEVLESMGLRDPFKNRNGFINEPLVRDGNIITAAATAFIDFSFEVADSLGLLSSQEQKEELSRLYKNI